MARMPISLGDRVEQEIAALDGLAGADLRQRWSALTGQPAPQVSPKLLRLAIAWQIQAKAFGGLSNATQRTLAQARTGKSKTDHARPGTRLVREWQGVVHVVSVDDDGVIMWNERNWSSLSAVARAITGGHWSGPAFFGLRKNQVRGGKSRASSSPAADKNIAAEDKSTLTVQNGCVAAATQAADRSALGRADGRPHDKRIHRARLEVQSS